MKRAYVTILAKGLEIILYQKVKALRYIFTCSPSRIYLVKFFSQVCSMQVSHTVKISSLDALQFAHAKFCFETKENAECDKAQPAFLRKQSFYKKMNQHFELCNLFSTV